jgi:hypothetical protein
MYVKFLGTSLAQNARACLKEIDTIEASLAKHDPSLEHSRDR